jgi:glycosyltransferase involved in cell wall biosynthesis
MASAAHKSPPPRHRRKSAESSQRVSLHASRNPLITIAIPTFNRAAWLKDCILSVLSQTYQNIEVIVSDNASIDETQEVLKSFSDRRLRVVKQENNIGLLPNWNACLAEANGEYIVIVPDDDTIAPWLLERSVALVRTDPQIPIVIALADIYFAAVGRTWRPQSNLATGIWNGIDILEELLKLPIIAGMSTFMIRTEALRARGGFPVDFLHAADMAVWVPLLFTGRAGFVNESCGTMCLHDARETSKLAIDLRLSDCEKVSNLIADLADRSIDDPKTRYRIEILTKRFFARSTFAHLAQFRREGAKLTEVLPLFWHWRHKLKSVGMGHAFKLAITLTVLILPVRIMLWSRHIRSNFRDVLSVKSSKIFPFIKVQ